MLKNKKIGFIFTGTLYSLKRMIPEIRKLVKDGVEIIPIISFDSYKTRKIAFKEFIEEIESITNTRIIKTIAEAEKIGKKYVTDITIIAPCSENTIAKLANGISDTPATVAVRSALKIGNNIVIGVLANDGLMSNAVNIGILLNRKNYYFIPFRQSNPITKPNALSFDSNYLIPTLEKASQNQQIQPILI